MAPFSVREERALFEQRLKEEARAAAEQIPAKEAAWEAERKKPSPDLNVKWIYAYVLVRSADARHKTVGIHLLKELVQARVNVDDSLYALAVAHYAMGKYGEAREEVDRLLRRNPDHRYGNELHLFIKDAQAKEDLAVGVGVGVVGVGLIGAAAVVFGALLGGGGRRGSR